MSCNVTARVSVRGEGNGAQMSTNNRNISNSVTTYNTRPLETIIKIFLTFTSTVTMGQQEYPSGARDMVVEMFGKELRIRRSAKPERMIIFWLSFSWNNLDHLLLAWQAAKI